MVGRLVADIHDCRIAIAGDKMGVVVAAEVAPFWNLDFLPVLPHRQQMKTARSPYARAFML